MPNRPVEPSQQDRTDTSAYTLDELTAATGLTVRTVRYYVSEGLLPPPHGAGPGTRYTREHLERLILIGALKDAYLPLREIRRRLATMTGAEISEAVERLHARSPEPADRDDGDVVAPDMPMASLPSQGTAADAAAYIEAVLRNDPESRLGTPVGSVTPRAARRSPGSVRFPGANEPDQQPDAGPVTWRRIAISPEAELLIEESTYRRRSEQIEALVAWAQRILTS